MLLRPPTLAGIANGTIDLVFRRQRRPTVKAGGTLRTAIGVLGIDAVDAVDETDITDNDARRAGFADRGELLAMLKPPRDPDGTPRQLYRIAVRYVGDDPRIALRENAKLSAADIAEITRRLERFDRLSSFGPWTVATLHLIAEHPETRAPELAATLGRDTKPFKTDVRKLKELGLTESLPVGYRLSPRGRAYLTATATDGS